MISIKDALSIIHNQEVVDQLINLPLAQVHGYCLGEPIISPINLPSFDNSAMDGYAICGIMDNYRVTGEVAAGPTKTHSLNEGEAMRIFTGGKIPENTTAVIMQEKAEVKDSLLYIHEEVIAGKNIRRKGKEIAEGQVVFEKGHPLSPASVGLIGALGMNEVTVFKKPVVRIITTGNELVPPGTEKKEGQIFESNSVALSGALQRNGFKSEEHVQLVDDFDEIKQGIGAFLEKSDVLLLSGGISVGDYDYVKQALDENGVMEFFYKVFQKPGKPLFFGRKENKFVFALPGNPASSLTCFYVYVLPLIQKMAGSIDPGLSSFSIPLAHDYPFKSDRPSFLKARIENKAVTILDGQGSSMIHSMAIGNALVFLNESSQCKKGDLVECLLL